MNLILCATIALLQTPTQRSAPAPAPAVRETIYVAAQGPPPTVTVQTPPAAVNVKVPSDWPTWIVGALGLLLVGFQVQLMRKQNDLMRRQTDAMSDQTALIAKQAALEEQQATWRRTEAIGNFYRLAFDLKAAFHRGNRGHRFFVSDKEYDYARQVFRQAPELLAPLGDQLLKAMSDAAAALDSYLAGVGDYNGNCQPDELTEPEHLDRYNTVLSRQIEVGHCMDRGNQAIPPALRWRWEGAGLDHNFAAEYNTNLFWGETRGRLAHERRQREEQQGA